MTIRRSRIARIGTVCVAASTVFAGLLVPGIASASTTVPLNAENDVVDDRVILSESFDSGSIPEGWNVVGGSWAVKDGALVGTSGAEDAKILFGENRENFAIDVDVTFDSAANQARWLALVLDAPADGSTPWQHGALRNGSTASNGVEFAQRTAGDTWKVTDTGSTKQDVGIGTQTHLRIEVNGNIGTWYVDGDKIMTSRQLMRTTDGVQGLIANSSVVSFDNIVVTEIDPLPPIQIRQPGETGVIVAHRGNSSVAPENTMPAFVSATRAGAEYFEIDLYMSADGVPVVFHDGTVDRTTDGTGSITAKTIEEIRQLDAGSWFAPAFAGTKVPTLEEVLTYTANGGADVVIEYKGNWSLEDTQVTVDMIEEMGVSNKVYAQSFSTTSVANFAEIAPDLPLAWLTGGIDESIVSTAKQIGADAINPSSATAESVALAHENDLGVFVWTKNDANSWASLTEMGVDGIITDRPDALRGWMQRYNQAPPTVEEPVEPEEPAADRQDIAVSIPESDQPAGEFTWRFSSQEVVSLGAATQLGDSLVATGALNAIEITDTRVNPSSPWTLSAQASAFTAGEESFEASALGWSPRLTAEGAGAVAGDPIEAGVGAGLSASAVLASAASDEFKGLDTASVTADLALRVPIGQTAGDYRSTMTVTVIQ